MRNICDIMGLWDFFMDLTRQTRDLVRENVMNDQRIGFRGGCTGTNKEVPSGHLPSGKLT